MKISTIRYLLMSGILLVAMHISAQQIRTTFKGIVIDETDLPLPGVTVMVLNAADSVLVQFAATDPQGAFIVRDIPKGEYLLNLAFLGMRSIYKPIVAGNEKEIDLGKIKMVAASTLLTEVEVKADYIPIEIKKDTITYNADAFQTQPNAVVEDMLKKMPGIEVQPDGSIKAQGENVEKVLVDGKEFFGTDPKMATKNLPAKAVKKVKVYDKKSDIAEFTGVDDGEREKTIDLQLKDEFKKGLFGKGEVGYGTDDKYNAKASFNRFSKTLQLSFLGQYNNINDQGFSFSDQMNFSGNSVSGGRGGGEFRMSSGDIPNEGIGTGLINTGAAGVNFNWQPNKIFNVRTSYFYNNVENTLFQQVTRQNLADIPFDTEKNTEKETTNSSHRISFNSEIKPDSSQEINLNGRINIGDGSSFNNDSLQNYIPGASIESESFTNSVRSSDNFSANGNSTYVRRFGDKGHNVATTFSVNKTNNDNASTLEAITYYFNTGSTEKIDQLQYGITDNFNWSGQFAFTQPLNHRRFFELNYYYSEATSDYDKQVSDVFVNDSVFNPDLSNAYSSFFRIKKPGATFRYSGETQNVNVSLQYQISELTGQDNKESGEIIKQYKHFLPRVIWRNDLGNGKNLRLSYTTRVNPPSITQLSPAVDNSDPLRLYLGNPDLNAEYNHSANLHFHSFTQYSSTSFFVSLSGGLTKDKIITARSIDALTREVTMPINIENEMTGNLYASFGRPFKPIHSRFNVNVNVNYTNTQSSNNNELLDLDLWSKSGGISFNNLNSQVVEYNFGGQWTFTDSYYEVDESLNQSTLMHNYFVDMSLTVWKKWKIGGSYNYNLYTSSLFPDQALPLMKAYLSRYIFPKDKGQLVFSVFDALDENRGLSRSAQVNYIEEIRSNSIGRYMMLSLVYNIRGKGEEPPGSPRIMGHRR